MPVKAKYLGTFKVGRTWCECRKRGWPTRDQAEKALEKLRTKRPGRVYEVYSCKSLNYLQAWHIRRVGQ